MPARIWPPPDDEGPQDLVVSEDREVLSDWLVQFEITLPDADSAARFTRAYGLRFQSAGVTARREKSWISLRVGATGEQEAGVLAAMTVKIAAALRLAQVVPVSAQLHHVERVGSLFGVQEQKRRAERAELMRLAATLPLPGETGPSAPPSGSALPPGQGLPPGHSAPEPQRVPRRRWLGR